MLKYNFKELDKPVVIDEPAILDIIITNNNKKVSVVVTTASGSDETKLELEDGEDARFTIQIGNVDPIKFGGTDNWGKDKLIIPIGSEAGSEEYDSILVNNITVDPSGGKGAWCKCEKIFDGNTYMLKYTALESNPSINPRYAYFLHKTTDKVISGGENVGRPAASEWWVTVMQEGKSDTPHIPIRPERHDEIIEFDDLLLLFENVIGKKIEDNSTVKAYLYDNYQAADDEWNNNTLNLFSLNIYQEIYNESDYRGDNDEYEINSYNAMQSWLMAMCLSEIVPTSGRDTNNQTKLFTKAYEIGSKLENGTYIPLYGGYTIKGDPMIARLVAGAIYAYNHDKYKAHMSQMRTELDGNSISAASWTELGYNNQDNIPSTSDSSMTNLGYLVNTNLVIPGSPGPFANGFSEGYFTNDANDLFYDENEEPSWRKYNYKVDVAIDNYITNNYILYRSSDNGYRLRIPANATEKENNLRTLEAATIPTSSDFVYFGKKRVKYTGNVTPQRIIDGTVVTNYLFEETSDKITDTNNVYDIKGPFASLQNVVFNGTMPVIGTDGVTYNLHKRTAHMEFLSKIMDIADNCRFPTMQRMWGRRRPLGGDVNKTARNNNIQEDPLNGISNASLECICARYGDDIAKWSNPEKADDFPHDSAKSYPSGHSVQAWTLAMYLGQITPSSIIEYMTKAYRFSVNRSVGRFHWNSDCIYGRLFGTMILPIINAMNGLESGYLNIKNAITGGLPIEEEDVTFDLTITNKTNTQAKLNGEMYFYLEKDGYTDYDNTGKYGWNGDGILLPGSTGYNQNSIIINPNQSRTFTITIPKEKIAQLSNKIASKNICLHDYNCVLYSYGSWNNGQSKGHISAAFTCGFVNNNTDGIFVENEKQYFVDITSVDSALINGEIQLL